MKKMTDATLPLLKRSELLFPEWSRGLNDEQAEVVRHDDGPCRVLAFAGAGKTESLARRIARMVAGGVDPSRILAVTFTKKGALEMQSRIAQKFRVDGARVGTWHSVCLQILRDDDTEWADWEIDGKGKSKRALKEVLGYQGMDWKGHDVTAVTSYIGRCKANLEAPDSPEASMRATREFGARNAGLATRAFQLYNDKLEEWQLLTYDDMLVFAARHLGVEENRIAWAARWDYLITDEYQDNNGAQDAIAEMLARDHRNIMVVGDPFQSLFGFRGSSPLFIARFAAQWPDTNTITLPRNYRSGRAIIAAANGVIGRHPAIGDVAPVAMVGARDLDGVARVQACEDLDDEGRQFAAWVKSLVATGDAHYRDFYALYRVNAQSRALEEALLGERVPYVVVKGVSFYERREVRDLLAYLRVAAERDEGDYADAARCINAPFRYLGRAFVQRVVDAAAGGSDIGWTEIVREVAAGAGIQSRQRASAEDWASLIERVRSCIATGGEDGKPAAILQHLVSRTRYLEWITKEEGEESVETSGCANVREMVRVAERFGTVGELLDYVDEMVCASLRQREDRQAGGDRVVLMSVHSAKGLEAPRVWVAGVNEMIMPHGRGDPDEERRIAYVAMTRARDELVLSHVRTMATRAGIKDAQPSRFLQDAGVPQDAPRGAPGPEPASLAPEARGGAPGAGDAHPDAAGPAEDAAAGPA